MAFLHCINALGSPGLQSATAKRTCTNRKCHICFHSGHQSCKIQICWIRAWGCFSVLQLYKSPGFLKEPPKGITYFFFKHFSVFLLLKGKCCRTYLGSDSGWQIKYELTVRHCSTKRQIPYLDVEQNYLQDYRGNNSSVHSPGEAPLGNCDQFWEIQYEEDGNKIEWIQWTVIKISKLEGMMYE